MIDSSKVGIGTKVHYKPKHYIESSKYENGIIKEVPESSVNFVRVVYNCGGDWANFKNYTSALTDVEDLYLGWCHPDITK